MKLTNEALIKSIRETGGYETPSERISAHPAKLGGLSSLRYASTILGVVVRCVWRFLIGNFRYCDWQRNTFRTIAFAEEVGSRISIQGFENLTANKGPFVYVMNHMSTLETMIAPSLLIPFGPVAIVLKKSLDEMPFVGKAARAVGSIAVSRTNAREDLKTVLTEGVNRLKEGKSVLLYPQGTRQAVFDPKKFNSLGAKLAERAGVPLVPIAVRTDILQTGKLIRDFGQVDPSRPLCVRCGAPIPISLGARTMHRKSVDFIYSTLKEWGLPTL